MVVSDTACADICYAGFPQRRQVGFGDTRFVSYADAAVAGVGDIAAFCRRSKNVGGNVKARCKLIEYGGFFFFTVKYGNIFILL